MSVKKSKMLIIHAITPNKAVEFILKPCFCPANCLIKNAFFLLEILMKHHLLYFNSYLTLQQPFFFIYKCALDEQRFETILA
jgi:hypothetical protein